MDDLKNHGTDTTTTTTTTNKNKSVINLNRSMTSVKSEITNKPLFNLYTLQRNGSIKNSSFATSIFQAGNSFKGKVQKLCSIFESPKYPSSNPIIISPKPETLLIKSYPDYIPQSLPDSPFRLPGTEDRVVVYYTSLRGIRRTFQDCHSVRMIFRGFRVNIDERDISMDSGYRKELQKVLGEQNVSLPQVFIKGKYIGGSDVVKQLLEAGELVKLMKGLPLRSINSCEGCDDARFFMCTNCDGSRKVFDEEEDGVKRCLECNENGLVRCPICCN